MIDSRSSRDVGLELAAALAIAADLAVRKMPLSQTARSIFATETHTGSRIFAALTGGIVGLFVAHILRPKEV